MAGKGGRTAAVVGWCLLLLSLTAPATAQPPSMTVTYPEELEENFSHVKLTCEPGPLGHPFTTATFARNNSGVYSEIMEGSDDVVSMVVIDGPTVEFVFNQSQEGAFSCESNGRRSAAEVLAASPPLSATGPQERYVLFPSQDSNRNITLSCGVRPGRERDSYGSAFWFRREPIEWFGDGSYDVPVRVNAAGPSDYCCIVGICHSTSVCRDYGTSISVNKSVLSTLAEDAVVAAPVFVGTVAVVTCKIIKEDTNFSISWRVDNQNVCDEDEDTPTDDITCSTNATHGVLQLENTISLGVGSHTVECVLEQDIDPLFIEDPSFEDEYEAVVVRSGVLEILTCVDGSVRLVDGSTAKEGRVEVCYAVQYRTVCDDSWDELEARVVCRQLNYTSGDSIPVHRAVFGEGEGEILLDDLKCTGDEATLLDCLDQSEIGSHNCRHGEDAGVICDEPSEECGTFGCEISPEPSSSTFSPGAVAAIVSSVMVVLLIVLLIVSGWLLRRHKRRKRLNIFPTSGTPETTFPLQNTTSNVNYGDVLQSPPSVMLLQLKDDLGKKNMLFPKSCIELTRVIGQGESGLVYRGYVKRGEMKELVAVKTGKALLAVDGKERLLKEVSLMFTFSHPNVMQLIGLSFDRGMPLIIMPLMSKGNVLGYVREHRESLYISESQDKIEIESARKTCLGMCYQISKGMSYLATYKFVHRDLAARNCMIDRNDVIKVSDFGLTEDMYNFNYYRPESSGTGSEEKVPIKWMAPESIETNVFDESTDVWSFGVTCWEVFTCGGVPYAGVPATTLCSELKSGHRLDRPSNLACSEDIWKVVTSCWSCRPKERPRFASLVNTVADLLDTDPAYIKLIGQS